MGTSCTEIGRAVCVVARALRLLVQDQSHVLMQAPDLIHQGKV